jgi:CRISPR-associated protein Csd1
MVDGFPLERSENLHAWWDGFRASFDEKPRATMRCLITGELAEPLPTVPKVSGLRSVGGHTAGDALLCFDKDAFTSYGFTQGENACVSEEAMTAVNAALGQLIARSPRLANARYVYFYKEPVKPAEDPMPWVFGECMTGDDQSDAAPENLDETDVTMDVVTDGLTP